MKKRVVISQSMYFPWVGLFEQIRLADAFVHYDDVQLSRGFYNRVQVKTDHGSRWITVPLRDHHQGRRIDETIIDNRVNWRQRHRDVLEQAYRKAPFRDDMLTIIDKVFSLPSHTLSDIARASILELADYFSLTTACAFIDSKALDIEGKGSQRILDIVQFLDGKIYITGHGARNYLDHELFEKRGISVQYMRYEFMPYPQLHGAFTPYVTALDLVANCGREGRRVIQSGTVEWREFMQ